MVNNLNKVKNFIRKREPIFHNREFTNSRKDVDNEIHNDF